MSAADRESLDQKTTRWLAKQAFLLRELDPVTFEFILDEPERAEECSEWIDWLCGGAS